MNALSDRKHLVTHRSASGSLQGSNQILIGNRPKNSVKLLDDRNRLDNGNICGIIISSHGVAKTSLTTGASLAMSSPMTSALNIRVGDRRLELLRCLCTRRLVGAHVYQLRQSPANKRGAVCLMHRSSSFRPLLFPPKGRGGRQKSLGVYVLTGVIPCGLVI